MLARIMLAVLFLIGFAGIVGNKNIIKKIFGLTILNNAAVLLFVMEGSRIGSRAPILEPGVTGIVDPVPQALMLTAIVIGVCVSALALALAFRLHRAVGSFNIDILYGRLHDSNNSST